MVNSTDLRNSTTNNNIRTVQGIHISAYILMVLFFVIFIYLTVIILKVFFTSPQVRETTRYILFIHMLLNDLVYLLISFVLFILADNLIRVHVPVCHVIAHLSTIMFRVTPYNLAVMSLERYAAICHPLRYAELCTVQRSLLSIAYMWIVGMIPQIANIVVYCCSADSRTFTFKVICDLRLMNVSNVQVILRNFTDIASFSLVGMIIAYTYVKVMFVARKMDSGNNASKAWRTVLLHAFQLLLSMLSLTSTLTETYLIPYFQNLPFVNFFLLMTFPRFISPLIYGLRDEVFGKPMRKFYSIGVILSSCQRVSRTRG